MLVQYATADHSQVRLIDQYGNDRAVAANYPGEFRMSNSVANVLAALGKAVPDAYAEPTPADPPLALVDIACVRLNVDGWDVTSLTRNVGASTAFVADTDLVWVIFDEAQPDTDYTVTPPDGVTKHEEYLEVTRPGLTSISLLVQRVQ